MIGTVIFDLDGVIVNSEPVHQRLESEMFSELNLEISKEDRKRIVGTSAVDMWKFIKREYEIDIDPDEMLLYGRKKYWDILENTDQVKLVPGIIDLLKELKRRNINLLIASSATSVTINKVVRIFNLNKWFAGIVGGDHVSNSKPDPEIFKKAAEMLGVDPSECMVIEDSTNGIKAAKAAGMMCLGYQNHHSGQQNLSDADWVVDDLNNIDLDKVLK
jgi:HAD superfamily hydrolase (TIGR01509 family)